MDWSIVVKNFVWATTPWQWKNHNYVTLFKLAVKKYRKSCDHDCHFVIYNEWFASNRIPMLCTKNSGIARGQTLLVARRKCMAKNCSTSKTRDFGERSTLFRRSFIANGLGECWYAEYVSSCLNNREICDKIYRQTSLRAWGLLRNLHRVMV